MVMLELRVSVSTEVPADQITASGEHAGPSIAVEAETPEDGPQRR